MNKQIWKPGALLAPVGQHWWEHIGRFPGIDMYAQDGAHASPAGSDFAAGHIWEVIGRHLRRNG